LNISPRSYLKDGMNQSCSSHLSSFWLEAFLIITFSPILCVGIIYCLYSKTARSPKFAIVDQEVVIDRDDPSKVPLLEVADNQ